MGWTSGSDKTRDVHRLSLRMLCHAILWLRLGFSSCDGSYRAFIRSSRFNSCPSTETHVYKLSPIWVGLVLHRAQDNEPPRRIFSLVETHLIYKVYSLLTDVHMRWYIFPPCQSKEQTVTARLKKHVGNPKTSDWFIRLRVKEEEGKKGLGKRMARVKSSRWEQVDMQHDVHTVGINRKRNKEPEGEL